MSGIDTRRITCVAIAVRDLDEKVRVWSEFLGIEPSRVLLSPSVEEAGTEYRGELTEGRLKVAVFNVGDCSLELLEPVGGPSVWNDFIEERGEGIHHIGFLADDMDEAVGSLERDGCALLQQARYDHGFGKGRYAYFDSAASYGAMIELNELK